MKEKTHLLVIEDADYQIERFNPVVGSYVLGRILHWGTKAMLDQVRSMGPEAMAQVVGAAAPSSPPPEEPSPDARIRRMVMEAFGMMPLEERTIIQRKCIEVCSRLEGDDPMPLGNASGMLISDLHLVMRLEMEALVFNFTDFFAQGGPKALLQAPAPRS